MEKGFVLWLTGLPGSGKTTISSTLAPLLIERGLKVEVMDGDEVRKSLSPDLGFSKEDREEHAQRVTYVSKLLARNGVVVIVALIAPYRSFRQKVRKEIENYVEVHVKASVEECIRRDPKGLYKKALAGEIKDMTGVDDPYEEPVNHEVTVDTERESVGECVERITRKLEELGYLEVNERPVLLK